MWIISAVVVQKIIAATKVDDGAAYWHEVRFAIVKTNQVFTFGLTDIDNVNRHILHPEIVKHGSNGPRLTSTHRLIIVDDDTAWYAFIVLDKAYNALFHGVLQSVSIVVRPSIA